ncbi:MAG: sigma-54 dependent transcriptional regulator [Myxococcota bacterium]
MPKTRFAGTDRSRQQQPRVLVVDDAEGIRSYLAKLLELRGYLVDTADDGRHALALLEAGADPDVVLLDVMMPGIDGIETLRGIRQFNPLIPVIMLSVVGRASTIVEAMSLGAADFINKPFEEDLLMLVVERVLEKRQLGTERRELLEKVGDDPETAVWESPSMRKIREVIEQISDTDVTVLIQGESGVGKEVVARLVHARSIRSDGPFVKVNCAALPSELLESELFGYEMGAFTGADARKAGRFELANQGTIFLDEIGEMSPGLQAKLLQVLQDGKFTRLGANEEVGVDVRIVCATNQPLREMIADRRFREDLYFRLNVVNIQIPPLRERNGEVPQLVDNFLRRWSSRYGKPAYAVSKELLDSFSRYSFPGNVRELENMIKRIVVLESETSVRNDLARQGPSSSRGRGELMSVIQRLEETAGEVPLREVGRVVALQVEKELIDEALRRTGWNRKQAAKLLNVSYKTLLQKIRDCKLHPEA